MAKAGKILIWSLIIGGAAVGICYIVKAIRDKNKDSENDDTQTLPDTSGGSTTPCTVVWPMQNGSGSGASRDCEKPYVKVIQNYLNKLVPNQQMSVDGDWGSTTERYITKLLGINSITEDQYNLMKAGKNPISKPTTAPYTFTVVVFGTSYTFNVTDSMSSSDKEKLITSLIKTTKLPDTTARRENLRKMQASFLATWLYYSYYAYPVFTYNGSAYSSLEGKKVKL